MNPENQTRPPHSIPEIDLYLVFGDRKIDLLRDPVELLSSMEDVVGKMLEAMQIIHAVVVRGMTVRHIDGTPLTHEKVDDAIFEYGIGMTTLSSIAELRNRYAEIGEEDTNGTDN